jgi:hypothetical protein
MTEDVSYIVALDWLVHKSRWLRADVIKDGDSAGWFVAQRAKTDDEKAQAHHYGVIVARGRPQ